MIAARTLEVAPTNATQWILFCGKNRRTTPTAGVGQSLGVAAVRGCISECSALWRTKLLWKETWRQDRLSEGRKAKPHVFDIHGGGLTCIPHHEDEIAQSARQRTDEMARLWLHNEMGFLGLQVEGKKMSKSPLVLLYEYGDLLEQGVPAKKKK